MHFALASYVLAAASQERRNHPAFTYHTECSTLKTGYYLKIRHAWCISDDVYNQVVVVAAGLLTNRRKLTFHWLLETDRLRAAEAEAKEPM